MRKSLFIFTFVLLVFFSGCGPIAKPSNQLGFRGDFSSDMELIPSRENALIYRRTDFRLRNFNTFRIDPVNIEGSKENKDKISDADKRELGKYLRTAVIRELSAGGYSIVTSGGKKVLGIRFILSEIDPGNPLLNTLQFHPYGVSLDVGGINIRSEFYDTTTGKVNAIAIVGAEGARKFNASSVMGEWGDVKKIFDDWAEGFRKKMDEEREDYRWIYGN